MSESALLLVGSPRGSKSTSDSLGTYLIEQLKAKGMEANKIHIHKAIRTEDGQQNLLASVNIADIMILVFPLYVDSLPAAVIKALEQIAQYRLENRESKRQRMIAIVNCGFPEALHNNVALAICQQFARESGFEWAGGLALGGGGAINGKPLKEAGGMVRNVVKVLDITASAIADGKPIPDEAVILMSKPIIPPWLYVLFGNFGWKKQAKKNNLSVKNLYDQPYKTDQ